jgi:hypothetical protein
MRKLLAQPIWPGRLKEERGTTACKMTQVHRMMSLGMVLLQGDTTQSSIHDAREKVLAITKMKPPGSLHEVLKLSGCMNTLSKSISRLGIRGLPFFKLLKKPDNFQWTLEAQEAFEDLKKYLTTPPTLVAPEPHENL